MHPFPIWIDVFMQPIRDNQTAQVAVMSVLLLTLADIAFGLIKAMVTRTLSSQKMRDGIGHKCVSFGLIFVADVIDGTVIGGLDLGITSPVLVASCAYLCIMEISSLMEQFVEIYPDLKGSPLFRLLSDVGDARKQ